MHKVPNHTHLLRLSLIGMLVAFDVALAQLSLDKTHVTEKHSCEKSTVLTH